MLADLAEQNVDDPEDDAVDEELTDDQADDGDETTSDDAATTSEDAATRPFYGRRIGSGIVDRWRPAVVLASETEVRLWATQNHLVKRSTSKEQVLYLFRTGCSVIVTVY